MKRILIALFAMIGTANLPLEFTCFLSGAEKEFSFFNFQFGVASAQTVTFDSDDFRRVGVYDTWEESPFRQGLLEGNAAVVQNHLTDVDADLGLAPNTSQRILAVQRSRYGSNTFGVRIDLAEPFELPTQARYVHVLVHKPIAGRVMLVGLGKRRERVGQSPETEQFWVLSSATVEPGTWCDAVFAIKGASGIDIHSLVVVPDCESPHRLGSDFVAYVDDICLNDQATPRIRRELYPVNFDRAATYSRTDRGLTAVQLQTQSVQVASSITTSLPVYQDLTAQQFQVKPGQRVTPTFTYKGSWMSGYVYVDYGQDGQFTATVNADGTPAEGSDLVSYSFYQNLNSLGNSVANGNVLNPPAFTVPASLHPGFYRMRYKVDWNEIDAGGNITANNHIINNGGAIVDVRLNVHGDTVSVNDANRNGEVLAATGEKLSGYTTPFGKAFTIRMNPERGFTYEGVRIRHGYNLAGDSLLHGTAQYADTLILRSRFNEQDEFTIPAALVDGNLEIEGLFVEVSVPDGVEASTRIDEENDTTLYDLQGCRVVRPQKHKMYVAKRRKFIR